MMEHDDIDILYIIHQLVKSHMVKELRDKKSHKGNATGSLQENWIRKFHANLRTESSPIFSKPISGFSQICEDHCQKRPSGGWKWHWRGCGTPPATESESIVDTR